MALERSRERPWRITARRSAYRNPWSEVIEEELVYPDGSPGLFAHLAPVDAVLVCPLFPNGDVVLVRQWRQAYATTSWELPCGRVEPEEDADTAARRELAEEGRLQAARWDALGRFHNSDSRVGGVIHCYLARKLGDADVAADRTEQDMVRERVALREALAAVEDGRIAHIATAFLLARVDSLLAIGR